MMRGLQASLQGRFVSAEAARRGVALCYARAPTPVKWGGIGVRAGDG